MSDAPLVQTHPRPAPIEPQIVAAMARAYELRVVEQTAALIVVEGREEELTAFAARLEQLTRLCR